MKETIKTVVIILLSILSIFLLIKVFSNKSKPSQISRNVSLDSSLTATPIKEYTDSNGIKHLVIDSKVNSIVQKEIERRATQKAMELSPIVDQIAASLDIKSKQVEGSTTISTRIQQDSIVALNHRIDSLTHIEVYDYKDKNLSLTFTRDSFSKGLFGFAYDADLNITQYWKRNKFLGLPVGAKKSYTDISSNDKRVTIKGVKKFTVIQNEPEFGVRIQALALENLQTHAFSIGPAIRVDGFKGSLRGSYYYNFQNKKWTPTVTLEKDLIRF